MPYTLEYLNNYGENNMKQLYTWCLCAVLIFGFPFMETLAETTWPADISIEADGGIVIDADTGAVLYGENIHKQYFPASITKLMTALLVIENCEMDETITFSDRAVNDVEEGSKSLGMVPGDSLSVEDALYGLLLHSSNETANALAEYVAGSIEDFADMMNKKAVELGCKNTHFANPSGLNNPEHYTTAYDMALIGQAVMNNEELLAIDSSLSYRIPPSKRLKEGQIVYPGHKMLKKSQAEYYPGVVGGKTGYTSLAGNTLVTFAQRDELRLVVVILNGHLTHYTDTKKLLDFGFKNFHSVKAADYDTFYSGIENDMSIAGLSGNTDSLLELDPQGLVTLPLFADFSQLDSELTYQLPLDAPDGAIAAVNYSFDGRAVGRAYLKTSFTTQETAAVTARHLAMEEETAQVDAHKNFIWIILLIVSLLLIFAVVMIVLYLRRKKNPSLATGSSRRSRRKRGRRFH